VKEDTLRRFFGDVMIPSNPDISIIPKCKARDSILWQGRERRSGNLTSWRDPTENRDNATYLFEPDVAIWAGMEVARVAGT
jgi:hypothetical protein